MFGLGLRDSTEVIFELWDNQDVDRRLGLDIFESIYIRVLKDSLGGYLLGEYLVKDGGFADKSLNRSGYHN